MSQQITFVDTNNIDNLTSCDFQHLIKQVACGIDFILLLTDNGHVYFKGELKELKYLDNFTKIESILSIIKYIASGEDFIILIDQFNKIFVYGEFGKENYKKFTEIGKIVNNDEIKFISCGADIVIVVTQKNELIIGGCLQAFNGQENIELTNTTDGFIKIDNVCQIKSEIKDLQCGYYHTIVLDYNGNIYGSGENMNGQLGLGKSNEDTVLSTLTRLNVPFKVKKIATTPEGTLLLNYHNELYGSGENTATQLGISDTLNIYEFTKIVIDNICVDNNDYNICVDNNNGPLIIKKLFQSAWSLTVILTENDGFYFTGQNTFEGFRKLKEIKDYKNWKYNYALLGIKESNDFVYLFQTNYKINEKQKRKNKLLFKKLLNPQNNNLLHDIIFTFLN
ncbi:hypothetical protein ABK040_005125 [Willaertia magna]